MQEVQRRFFNRSCETGILIKSYSLEFFNYKSHCDVKMW